MQDDIVARITNALNPQLIDAAARRAERSSIPDATDLILQGRSWLHKGITPDYMLQARPFFERAMALDPGNIDAMVGLGWVDAVMGVITFTDDWRARFAAAEATLTKVLSLAPNHALAHLWLGWVYILTKRAEQGINEFEQALALEPVQATASSGIGYAKVLLGRAEETEAHVNEALRLSPRDTYAYLWMAWVGFANVHLHRDTEAVAWLRRGLEANRNYSVAHFYLAAALARLGETCQARVAVQAGLALDPTFTIRRWRGPNIARSDNPTFLAGCERTIEGMRLAGVPEG
jgi:tetratricopeptide (TPR) repeat protein